MSLEKNETIILKNTIPETYLGRPFNRRFGTGYAFTFDQAVKANLYFQSQVFLQILNPNTEEVLFEFRTFTMFQCKKRIEDNGFYELIYSFLLTAIECFNGKLKLNNSTLTINRTYLPIPTIEQAKTPIKQAYMLLDFNIGVSKN